MYDFNQHKFRCSSWGNLFSDPKGKTNIQRYNEAIEKVKKLQSEYDLMPKVTAKNEPSKAAANKLDAIKKADLEVGELFPIKDQKEMSVTAKKHCLDIYSANQHNLHTDKTNRALDKGTLCEEDSITLYSRVKKKLFRKNDERLYNDFIQGEPDLFTGEIITMAESIIDVKTSWDGITFHRNLAEDLKDIYFYQLQGYMWLTGAKFASVAYCLVDTPDGLIEQAKKSLWYKLGCPKDFTSEYELFEECCNELQKSMKYDHIPLSERIIEFDIEFDQTVINEGKDRISDARKYLVEIQKSRHV